VLFNVKGRNYERWLGLGICSKMTYRSRNTTVLWNIVYYFLKALLLIFYTAPRWNSEESPYRSPWRSRPGFAENSSPVWCRWTACCHEGKWSILGKTLFLKAIYRASLLGTAILSLISTTEHVSQWELNGWVNY
jgi:hypothetical protein